MNKPLISIIVPAYNVEPYIKQCIESIVNQTYDNWELLLVVGGQDRTAEICDEYAAKDERIKSIHDNKGLAPARNVGYENATGEWFMFVDGDDWIDLNTCEKFVEQIHLHPKLDLIFYVMQQELNGKTITDKWKWEAAEDIHLYSNGECKMLALKVLDYRQGIASAANKLINKNYAKENDITHDRRLTQGIEGAEFSIKAFYYARECLYMNQHFYHYRYNPDSITKTGTIKNAECITDCLKVIDERINNFDNKEAFHEALCLKTIYTLISIAMSTYFHPNYKATYRERKRQFEQLINSYGLYGEAIKNVPIKHFDKLRAITFFCIKHKFYLGILFIAQMKQMMIKMGYFKY